MSKSQTSTSPLAAIDEVLLDVATFIELSPSDRRVAENRYRRLKTHLQRPSSALSRFLLDGENLIYAQGSIATSTTIISGTDEDRFDVDAIVEIDVPEDWSDEKALDLLEVSLQGFPGVSKIVRCTRCVQLQFPFMHMDVAILDRRAKVSVERAGDIFHSPDEGDAYRVASNPWGFTGWFRSKVVPQQTTFVESLQKRRASASRSRLTALDEEERQFIAEGEQKALPPAIPSRLDAQEAVALKLLKRFLNVHYARLAINRPPSIYLTKVAGDLGYCPEGLTIQLFRLAHFLAGTLDEHIARGTRPVEVNPSYPADVINDRWPRKGADGIKDMAILVSALRKLASQLKQMSEASLADIVTAIDELFGERVGAEQRRVLKERYERKPSDTGLLLERVTGQVFAPAIVRPSKDLRQIPRHSFHCSRQNRGSP